MAEAGVDDLSFEALGWLLPTLQAAGGNKSAAARQLGVALKKLRVLGRRGAADELDLEASVEATSRQAGELELENLNEKLAKALAEKEKLLQEIKVLEGLLPICSACKRIRDENGRWWPLDIYVKSHTDVEITHTICTDCKSVLYADMGKPSQG